jgi:hypothetical protein
MATNTSISGKHMYHNSGQFYTFSHLLELYFDGALQRKTTSIYRQEPLMIPEFVIIHFAIIPLKFYFLYLPRFLLLEKTLRLSSSLL